MRKHDSKFKRLIFFGFVAAAFVSALAGIAKIIPARAAAFVPLSFSERVGYERAVQKVYFELRTRQAGGGQAFDAVLPLAASEARVADVLGKSNALEKLHDLKITPEMLQAEIERMSRETRQPEVLREIFAALGNDARLVAEIVARPNLVDRFAAGNDFEARWQQEKNDFSTEIIESNFPYRLPEINFNSNQNQPDDTWREMPAMPELLRPRMAIWTGVEMIVWGGGPDLFPQTKVNSGSRYNPVTDMWLPVTGFNAPSRRTAQTLVWTGTEMIVWGGCTTTQNFCSENSGGRYNPATDSWTPTSVTNAPSPRHRHTAVWTGDRMIVWGGCRQTTTSTCRTSPLPEGGMYFPATDSWQPVATADVGQVRHTAVWTGMKMIVFGGYGEEGNNKLGGRYNPNTNTWTPLNPAGAPFPRLDHTAVWTGIEMIVWGGVNDTSEPQNTGARYNPATNTWTPTSLVNAPSPRRGHTAVWTGTVMIVWGGDAGGIETFNNGARYNPANDTWTATNTANAPPPRTDHVAVWTGTEMIVWGAAGKTGGRYNPATDSWTPTGMNDAPVNRTQSQAVWTGAEMIVFGGDFGNIGSRYNPATMTWTPIRPLDEIPVRNDGYTLVWTGTEMIVWGGGITVLWGDGARYNPATDTWTVISQTNAPAARTNHTAVWTGAEMIVWGGQTNNGVTNTGGRYNPSTNSWTPTSTSGAPEARYLHTAVVVGDQMIVWGGVRGDNTAFLNTGGRYNFTNDTWQPTATAGAPSPRYLHTAISTGTEMIVWGGRFTFVDTPSGLNTGGRYNPVTNTWQPTSTVNAPSPRSRHTAVWTGTEMIVYAGNTESFFQYLNTGGRYNPATDSWRATTLARVGTQRADHVAVWTGKSMLVWGGSVIDGDARAGYEYFARSTNRTPFDFDGDRRADISVYRDGVWYLQQSTAGFRAVNFGLGTDRLAPADYDGDGKFDIAVFRAGVWYIINSSNNSFRSEMWGIPARDTPVPRDYDGDGRADLAVFRYGSEPSTPTFYYVLNSSDNSFRAVQMGDGFISIPVPSDYDGDNRADPAVYSEAGGFWTIINSSNNLLRREQFGNGNFQDIPVPADYDGDGKTDLAVFRRASGTWFIQQSRDGFRALQFGVDGDRLTPADYDGDGRADIAVFRNGTWYLQRSTGGFAGVQFGLPNDIPVSAPF